jgi:hypothetical protein
MDAAIRCDRVALIQGGRILDIDDPRNIGGRFTHPLVAVRTPDRYRALHALRRLPTAHSVYPFGETLHYADTRAELSPDALATDLRQQLEKGGFAGVEVGPVSAGIEDVFMELMSRPGERAA